MTKEFKDIMKLNKFLMGAALVGVLAGSTVVLADDHEKPKAADKKHDDKAGKGHDKTHDKTAEGQEKKKP